ncbi:hypothetical protein [Pseudomonas typographi]|uniref:Uncharacterized protein n=1 Tax=Pseudomonas typographi TaxID=2715964 RepID=A0ABR7YY45_9PSED|nr:hypothetical protein [Pseudomonas typographi]MBD1598128.1 hypothetical protein [Pseudomonas typographi]
MFVKLSDAGRFIGLLVAVAAILSTLITLGANIDTVSEALHDLPHDNRRDKHRHHWL